MSDKETIKALFEACYKHGHESGRLTAMVCKLEGEIEQLKVSNESLKTENAALRKKMEKASEQ